MFGLGKKTASAESYKGVRDFFPEDQAIQNYIFEKMRAVAEAWGYVEYGASVLEPLDLYKSKSSEEIVNEQIYSFKDRGDREVVLRPEMTPTVARMIARKIQELPAPIRWYSVANFFRYEKPQRGRFREFWQLNLDIFGVANPTADAEVINIAYEIMERFGAKPQDFEIRVSSRPLLDDILKKIKVDDDKRLFLYRLIDKKDKMPEADFRQALKALIGEEVGKDLMEMFYFGEGLLSMLGESQAAKNLLQTLELLRGRGIKNLVFTPTLTRGFDYYTGLVFEVFDTNKENLRSLFGGGRYDDLVGFFTNQKVPACGFGMGDVTVHDFLVTHNLLPRLNSTTDLYICLAPETDLELANGVANQIRAAGLNVAVDLSGKKLADQLKSLDKRKIPYVMTIGPTEIQSQKFTLRNTETREEQSGDLAQIIGFLK